MGFFLKVLNRIFSERLFDGVESGGVVAQDAIKTSFGDWKATQARKKRLEEGLSEEEDGVVFTQTEDGKFIREEKPIKKRPKNVRNQEAEVQDLVSQFKALPQKPSNKSPFLAKASANPWVQTPEVIPSVPETSTPTATPSKDGKGYNLELMSYMYDHFMKGLLENGVRKIAPGEVIRFLEKGTDWKKGIEYAVEHGWYRSYPFQITLGQELITMFLLKTHETDEFENLWSRFKNGATKFLSSNDIEFLEKVVRAGNERLRRQSYVFPMPMKSRGRTRKGTIEDMRKSGSGITVDHHVWKEYEKDFFVEDRVDGPDLLALKELVLIVEGAEVHPLSIGPGFFCKYMKEVSELSLGTYTTIKGETKSVPLAQSIIFKVVDNKLAGIKIGAIKEFEGLEGKVLGLHNNITCIRFLPSLLASASLVYSELVDSKVYIEQVKTVSGKIKDCLKVDTKFKGFDERTKYFVVVDGMVSGPSTKRLVDENNLPALNDTRIPAGECFLYEKEGEDYLSTRIYFTPYELSAIMPCLYRGTVIFGVDDHSFHSTTTKGCYPEPPDEWQVDSYKHYIKRRWDNGCLPYQPADVAAQIHYFPRTKNGDKTNPMYMFHKDNEVALCSVIEGVIEHNPYCFEKIANIAKGGHGLFFPGPISYAETLAAHDYPLSHRWNLKKYIEDGRGITKELQPTFYTRIRDVVEENEWRGRLKLNSELIANRQKKAGGEEK